MSLIKGIIKVFIIISLFYLIDIMLSSLYQTPEQWNSQTYSYTLQELKFCDGGEYRIFKDSILCNHIGLQINFTCSDGYCRQEIKKK